MLLLKKSDRKESSRRNIEIESVTDGILKIANNRYRAILRVSSINLNLKSEAEQEALVAIYQGFLNSLKSSVQVIIRTRTLDADTYVDHFKKMAQEEGEDVYKKQIEDYSDFVHKLVVNNKILSKEFYVVVQYDAAKDDKWSVIKDKIRYQCGDIAAGLSRLGITSRALSSVEVLELFNSFYNPERAKLQPITNATMDLIKDIYL